MTNKILLIVICLSGFADFAQSQVIQGKITDAATGTALPGANIIINIENKGTISASDGTYQFTVPEPGKYTLSCSFIGYITVEKSVIVSDSAARVNFELDENQKQLEEVIVHGEITGPVKRTGDALYTGSAITSKGISLMGASASSSVYNALDIIPGISVEGQDAYGLSEKSVIIRSINSKFSGMTIEGFPNYGIMPIGSRDDIYDMENMQSVAVFKGATPADLGTATGSKGGTIELQYKRPSDIFTVNVKESAGSNNYFRSFARIDMGKLKTGTNAFVSGSITTADKWKGYGKLGPRYNVAIGITQIINKKLNVELFENYNTINRHAFKKLIYTEASDIENSFNNDFNETLTGNPTEDLNYYDYNKGLYTNRDFMGIINYNITKTAKITLKTYYSNEDADYDETIKKGTNNFVNKKIRDIKRMGLIPELSGSIMNIHYTMGYWFESSDNNANVYNSRIVDNGLNPVGYSFYTVNKNLGKIHSPYLKLALTKDKFNIQAGLKYFYYEEPESDRYTSLSPTELSLNPDADLHTKAMKYNALLPTMGIGYNFSNSMQAYINYGRNYMRPYMYVPIISLYVSNKQAFIDNNMNLQDIFDSWTMETSDNVDLGVHYSTEKLTLSPSVFYAKHHNELASAYDSKVQLDYYQNIGELTAYGFDLECYIRPVQSLIIFINPAFNSMSYDNNLVRKSGAVADTISIKGNQSPAVPKISLKSGIFYSIKNFDFSLFVKHTGERFGDATNKEKIDAYTLADMGIKYSRSNVFFIKNFQAGIEIKNLFDTKYVGSINASDDSNQGSATYFAGMPRSIIGSITITF